MPTERETGYKLIAGHVDFATAAATDSIVAFPLQSDMDGVQAWAAPVQAIALKPATRVRLLSPIVVEGGVTEGEWVFSYWTFDMLAYILTTFFNDTDKQADVTIVSFDDRDQPRTYQAVAIAPESGITMTPQKGGWTNIRLTLTHATEIFAP